MGQYRDDRRAPLQEGESLRHSFAADGMTYLRDNAWLAAIAMILGMAILWFMGNPHVWTGAVGGLAAIVIRGWYMSDEELGARWDITETRLIGPQGRVAQLNQIKQLNKIFSIVQVVTTTGDKHLIKYQPDPADTIRRIEAAQHGGDPGGGD